MTVRRELSDDQVVALPLGTARVDLMEEIMSMPTTVPDRTDSPRRPPSHPRWSVVVGAAAAIAAIIAVPVWLGSGADRAGGPAARPASTSAAPVDLDGPPRPYAVLVADGWTITDVDGTPADGEAEFTDGDRTVQINWRPAGDYDGYVADRSDIGPSADVDLVGASSLMWTYAPTDRTTIRPVDGDTFLEVRGEGMRRAAYLQLLAAVHGVDETGFASFLPGETVPPDEVDAEVARLLTGVTVPTGFDSVTIDVPRFADDYDAGVAVTSTVGCAWLAQYKAARASGDAATQQQAASAMAASHDWPVLRAIESGGGWSEVFWEIADDMAGGKPLPEAEQGIGCDD